ncbi:hypothetical protein RJ639_040833 [Escallonia herrerae]|uniref:Plastocyanin-like domain-containing protein n=1 Tax=Escallonia herrerae TaxID=1293975 RepID=A0AA88WIS5_9ASTE|nr:hypothetical protein RJ639_040833 [Escallonia herrerae]
MPFPFSTPVQAEIPILLGEWWNEDTEMTEKAMVLYGDGPNASDAYTINGLPGSIYPCSNKGDVSPPLPS